MRIVSVSNIKGGVAKTTTAATLAAGLNHRGKKVIMIDSDPQMNLTLCFTNVPDDGNDDLKLSSLYTLYDKDSSIESVRQNIRPGLDLVIGDFELCSADLEFFKRPGSLKVLSKALEAVKDEYDFAIIDTPPNLGYLSLNAFMASTDGIIAPMAADTFSLKAARLLERTLKEVSEDASKEIPVLGILLTRYDSRTNISKALEGSVKTAAQLLDTTLFNSRIREATVVKESQLTRIDLFDYAPKAPVTKDYSNFIDEFLTRIGDD